jgi:hypothetical protein
MPAIFRTTIDGLDTANEGSLVGVVKRVHFLVSGTQDNRILSTAHSVDTGPADPNNFTPLHQLSKDDILAWVDSLFAEQMPVVKAAIQSDLDLLSSNQ